MLEEAAQYSKPFPLYKQGSNEVHDRRMPSATTSNLNSRQIRLLVFPYKGSASSEHEKYVHCTKHVVTMVFIVCNDTTTCPCSISISSHAQNVSSAVFYFHFRNSDIITVAQSRPGSQEKI